MKKIVAIVLVLSLLVLGLAACGGKKTEVMKAIDAYEKAVDEYVDFMKDYDAATDSAEDLAKAQEKVETAAKAFRDAAAKVTDPSDKEKEYVEKVSKRITEKMAKAMQ